MEFKQSKTEKQKTIQLQRPHNSPIANAIGQVSVLMTPLILVVFTLVASGVSISYALVIKNRMSHKCYNHILKLKTKYGEALKQHHKLNNQILQLHKKRKNIKRQISLAKASGQVKIVLSLKLLAKAVDAKLYQLKIKQTVIIKSSDKSRDLAYLKIRSQKNWSGQLAHLHLVTKTKYPIVSPLYLPKNVRPKLMSQLHWNKTLLIGPKEFNLKGVCKITLQGEKPWLPQIIMDRPS